VRRESVPISIVFSGPLIGRTLVGILLNVVMGFCLYGFLAWLPTIFVKQGFSIVSSLKWTAVMAIGGPVGGLIGLLVADRFGRKWTVVVASLVAAGLGIRYPMIHDANELMAVGFVLVTSVYVIVAVGFALWVPELYDTRYRMRGAAVCSTAGRLVTAVIQPIIVFLLTRWGVSGVVDVLVALLVVQALAFAFFAVETRQQTLENLAKNDGTAAA
jgi:putative MFS transporter